MGENKCFKRVVVSSIIAIPMLAAVQGNTLRIDTAYRLERPAIVRVVDADAIKLPPEYVISKAGNAIDIELARVGNAVDIELA